LELSIQQKQVNFEPLSISTQSMPRISFFIIALVIINHAFVYGQNTPITIDLGVFNGEVGRVEREFNIHVLLPSSTQSLTSHRLELKKLVRDNQDSITRIVIQLDLPKESGNQLDTISFLSEKNELLQEVHLSYQVLTPVSDLFKSYRNEYWPFKSKEQVFNLGIGTNGDTLQAVFDLLNFSGSTLDLNEIQTFDDFHVAFYPKKVEHNAFTRIELKYQSNEQSELGFQRYSVPLIHDDDTISFLPIQFSLIPRVDASDARLIVNRDEFDFKVIIEGQEVSEVVFISNNGTEPLKILKVETNCDCLLANISSRVIAPGGNAQLRLKFLSAGRDGLERKTITLFTNDPKSPVKDIVIKAHVK
jgi:hypothetical protein